MGGEGRACSTQNELSNPKLQSYFFVQIGTLDLVSLIQESSIQGWGERAGLVLSKVHWVTLDKLPIEIIFFVRFCTLDLVNLILELPTQ